MRSKNSGRISRRGPILALSLGGVVLIAAIAAATAISVFASRDRAISSARRELQNNAYLVARHYEHMLGEFTEMMRTTAAEIELDRILDEDIGGGDDHHHGEHRHHEASEHIAPFLSRPPASDRREGLVYPLWG